MGNKSSKKYDDKTPNLKKFSTVLSKVCENQEFLPAAIISSARLEETWKTHLSPEHLNLLMNYFIKEDLTILRFIEFYQSVVECSPDDKMTALFSVFECQHEAKMYDICQYVNAVVKSSIKILSNTETFKIWNNLSMSKDFMDVSTVSKYILADLHCEGGQINESDVASWFYRSTLVNELSEYVYQTIYDMRLSIDLKLPAPFLSKNGGETILSAGELLFFTLMLQRDYVKKWRLLFSSTTSGQSWATFCKCITSQGPTLVIIRSNNDVVLGGFAATSWTYHTKFFGTDLSFIFQLRPSIKIFDATNYNKNFQYFNTGQATLPNGLGMGGQFGYWGFFVSSDFNKCNISESCSTFKRYKIEGASKEFDIKDIEVWGVDKPDPTSAELGERSTVLDKDPALNAILELAGKTMHSSDIRAQKPIDELEPPETKDNK